MATTLLPAAGIVLHGAPDVDIGSRDAKHMPAQAMQVELTDDMVDELLESVRSGKPPQIFFGRTPQLKYADKTHVLQTSSESYRYELYHASGAGRDDSLEFTALINHSLTVQKAENVTAGVDTALEQLKNSMAAISELKEANKTIVGDATPNRTPGHRRVPSKGIKAQHLASSALGSPQLNVSASPMSKRPPTSQPGSNHIAVLNALRVPLIHLLAIQPSKDTFLATTCRTLLANVRDLLPKIAKRSSDDADKWQLTDKSFREFNPYQFTYKKVEDREQAINSAIKSFDRLRLAKDDKLWQILLPREERGQGKCLSRLTVKTHEAKPSTPMHKMTKMNEKKPALKKAEERDTEKELKKTKDVKVKEVKVKETPKVKKPVKEKVVKGKIVRDEAKLAAATGASSNSTTTTSKPTAPFSRNTPLSEATKARTKKAAPAGESTSTPRVKPKMSTSAREAAYKERVQKSSRPPINTKPKNPSPLSASPPVNASDFEDNHPVHKAFSAAPSPAKTLAGNSDRILKRKANDIDSNIHNHALTVKAPRLDRVTPNHTPSSTNGRVTGDTPSSTNSMKRKSDESSTSNTPSNKVRKVTSIDTGLASRYPTQNSQISPGDTSSSTTSPSLPSLSFRQTVELSQKFQKYYKRYEELYWKLTEAEMPPTEAQRGDLLKMHKKLEEMKREIKAGAGVHRRT